MILGFSVQEPKWSAARSDNFYFLLLFNLILFLSLIMALSPQRQALQDWARYRRQRVSHHQGFWNFALVQDLIWPEKSPGLVAIAINLAIAALFLGAWILFWPQSIKATSALAAVAMTMMVILIYAAIAQLMFLIPHPKRTQWAAGVLSALIVLPPIVFNLLLIQPSLNPEFWLFSAVPWVAVEHASTATIFLSLLAQLSILTGLSWQLTRRLRQAGESASKALRAGVGGRASGWRFLARD